METEHNLEILYETLAKYYVLRQKSKMQLEQYDSIIKSIEANIRAVMNGGFK